MSAVERIVEATEGLYLDLFRAAAAFSAGTALWGLVLAPFNAFQDERVRSVALGIALSMLGALALWQRRRLYHLLRGRHDWLLLVALASVAVLWADGGWRSTYYLASYAAIALSAVVAGPRWALACAGMLAAGYVGGLAHNGYTWDRLQALKDADSVVANTGGYFIAALAFALPVRWLGGYVARISLTVDDHVSSRRRPMRARTNSLSPREVQVVQLLTDGQSNERIAATLVVSPRTVQTHVANALRKTKCASRTCLAVLAVREGLVPLEVEGTHRGPDANALGEAHPTRASAPGLPGGGA